MPLPWRRHRLLNSWCTLLVKMVCIMALLAGVIHMHGHLIMLATDESHLSVPTDPPLTDDVTPRIIIIDDDFIAHAEAGSLSYPTIPAFSRQVYECTVQYSTVL
jgi:hypothetical protein